MLLAACFVLCFTRFHQVLGWSSCLALSNQQACGRPYCFTGRSRPLGTCFLIGYMVLPFDLLLPRLRFPPYGFLATGSPRLIAIWFFCHRQSSLLATRSFLSSPCTDFDPTDFCHLRRRTNLLICLIAIFGLNDYLVRFCFNLIPSNCGS